MFNQQHGSRQRQHGRAWNLLLIAPKSPFLPAASNLMALNSSTTEGTVTRTLQIRCFLSPTFTAFLFEFQHSKDRQLLSSVTVYRRPVRPSTMHVRQIRISPNLSFAGGLVAYPSGTHLQPCYARLGTPRKPDFSERTASEFHVLYRPQDQRLRLL